MKKLYTLMAAAVTGLSAWAVPATLNVQPVKVSQQAIQRSQMRLDNMLNAIQSGQEVEGMITKNVTIDGIEYTAYLNNHGPATRVANSSWIWGTRLYDVDFILASLDNQNYYQLSVLWPTKTIMNLLKLDANASEDDLVVDNTMLTPEELIAISKQEQEAIPAKFIYNQPGFVNIFAEEDNYVIGWFAYAGGGLHKGNAIAGINKGAEVEMKAVDLKAKTEDIVMKGQILGKAYDENGTNTPIGSFNLAYNSTVSQMEGWVTEDRTFTIGQMHLSYTGEKSNKNWDYYDENFGPLRRYYINACNDQMTYDPTQWNGTKHPYYHASETLGLGRENNPSLTSQDAVGAFIQGAIYTPTTGEDKNAFYHYGYTQIASEIEPDTQMIVNYPKPYTCQEAWANLMQFAIRDGMTGAYNNRYVDWYNVKIDFGGDRGFVFKAEDTYRNRYSASFVGNIYFHSNPEKLQDTVEITATDLDSIEAMLTEGTAVVANNGAITVVCDGAKNVVVYNLAGAMLRNTVVENNGTFEMPAGTYIVKVGNRAFKVML